MVFIAVIWLSVFVLAITYTAYNWVGARNLKARAEACQYWDTVANRDDLTFLEP